MTPEPDDESKKAKTEENSPTKNGSEADSEKPVGGSRLNLNIGVVAILEKIVKNVVLQTCSCFSKTFWTLLITCNDIMILCLRKA